MGETWGRRHLLKLLGTTVFASWTAQSSGATTSQPSADGWPMFHHNHRNTGHAPNETGPTEGVKEQWRFQTDIGVESSPAVVDGTVYVGSGDDHLYALDASDGTEQWRFQTDRGVESSPAVVDDTVYVGSWDGSLYAVDASDGTEQWRFQTDGEVASSPAVVDGTVYVGSFDHLYALDASDGTEQWRFQTDRGVESSPAVVDGTVYVGSGDDHLYALDASDGTEQWRFQTDIGVVESSPAVADGTVYVGSRYGTVYAVDESDGTEQWRFQTDWPVRSSPAVADGTVYVGSGDDHLYALDASDGTEQWRFKTDSWVESSPAVVDDTVYVGSGDDHLYALDASDGTEQWRFQTGGGVESSPAVVDDTVYVGSRDGHVYALGEGRRIEGSAGVVVPETDHHLWEQQTWGMALAVTVGATSVAVGRRTRTSITYLGVAFATFLLVNVVLSLENQFPDGTLEYARNHTVFYLVFVLVPVVMVVGVAGIVQYMSERSLRRSGGSTASAEQPAPIDERTAESGLKQGETTREDIEEWLAEAEAARQRGNDAMEAGNHNQAAEAYRTALEHFQTVRTQLPDDDDRHQTVETAVAELQEAHQEAVQYSDQQPPPTQDRTTLSQALPEKLSWILDWYIRGTVILVTLVFIWPIVERNLYVVFGPGGRDLGLLFFSFLALLVWRLTKSPKYNLSVRFSNNNEQSNSAASPQQPNKSPETLIEKGDVVQTAGDSARAEGDYETAVKNYSTAIDAYQQAQQQLDPDDDRAEMVVTALETVESAHQEAVKQRDQRADLRQGLEAAEEDLATAAREHSQGNETVARIRYRQARDRYENVLAELENDRLEPPVEVSLESDGRPGLGAVEGVTEEVTEAVRELVAPADNPAPTALQEAGVSGLTELDGVDEDLAQRLVAWARVPTGDTRQFETRDDITDRRELAVEGFQHCQ